MLSDCIYTKFLTSFFPPTAHQLSHYLSSAHPILSSESSVLPLPPPIHLIISIARYSLSLFFARVLCVSWGFANNN